jgi:hypothetical protein
MIGRKEFPVVGKLADEPTIFLYGDLILTGNN